MCVHCVKICQNSPQRAPRIFPHTLSWITVSPVPDSEKQPPQDLNVPTKTVLQKRRSRPELAQWFCELMREITLWFYDLGILHTWEGKREEPSRMFHQGIRGFPPDCFYASCLVSHLELWVSMVTCLALATHGLFLPFCVGTSALVLLPSEVPTVRRALLQVAISQQAEKVSIRRQLTPVPCTHLPGRYQHQGHY